MAALDRDKRESVGQILKAGQHLLGLINEVLEISRIEAGRLSISPEAVQIGLAVQEALDTSAVYRPVLNPADAQYVIGIVTMDPDEAAVGPGTGQSTVASVTLQLENTKGLNHFVYSWVLVANQDKVDVLTVELFSAIDREIQDLNAQVAR